MPRRFHLTISQHSGMVAAFINASGGNIDDFPISKTSTARDRHSSGEEIALKKKEEFKNQIKDGKIKLVVHSDGKLLVDETGDQLEKVNKEKKDRLAVLVSSPDLSDKEQLLGIPKLDSGTGRAQEQAVGKLLDEYGAASAVIGTCYDTTGSNTGKQKGYVILLEKRLKKKLLKMPCRRHQYELHVKHAALSVSKRKTISPGDELFKLFSSNWDQPERGGD